jgi:hypothetical protein
MSNLSSFPIPCLRKKPPISWGGRSTIPNSSPGRKDEKKGVSMPKFQQTTGYAWEELNFSSVLSQSAKLDTNDSIRHT